MSNHIPKDPDKRATALDNIIKDVFDKDAPHKSSAERSLDDIFQKGAEINKRVQEVLRKKHAHMFGATMVPKEQAFATVHKAYLDVLTDFKLKGDELLFLYAYNATKLLMDQI